MARAFNSKRLRFVLGDVRDEKSLYEAFDAKDLVVHAAALKRVGGGEEYPEEYIQTNVLGSINVVNACLKSSVDKALLLSTDKAVAPVNLYGCTKQMGEKIFLKANDKGACRFGVIRYGNILGSNGSVVEKWRSNSDSYVVDAYRFWIGRREAAEVIVHVAEDFESGEIAIAKTFSSDVKLLYNYVAGKKPTAYGRLNKGERRVEYLMSEHEGGVIFCDRDVMWMLPDGEDSPSYEMREEQFIEVHPPGNYDSYSNPRRVMTDADFDKAVADAIPR